MALSRDEMIAHINAGRSVLTQDIHDADGRRVYVGTVCSAVGMLPEESLLASVDPDDRERQQKALDAQMEQLLNKKAELDRIQKAENARAAAAEKGKAEDNKAIHDEAEKKVAEDARKK